MRIDYILMVVESIESYFFDQFDISLRRSELELRQNFGEILDGIYVNLKGSVEGKIVVSFSSEFAKFIAQKMTEGLGIEEDKTDSFYEAALKEVVNQMTAAIINRVDEEGYDWDIDVPFLIVNGEPKINSFSTDVLVVPYENMIGKMEITVALKEIETKV